MKEEEKKEAERGKEKRRLHEREAENVRNGLKRKGEERRMECGRKKNDEWRIEERIKEGMK